MQLIGKVLTVDTRNLAEVTLTDEAAGATVLELTDAGPFSAAGGTCIIEGTAYPYIDVNYDADTITLGSPLAAALAADARVEVYPPAPEKYATVDLGGEGEAVPVLVPHHLVELLPDGVRDPSAQETVSIETSGYALTITDVVARELARGTVDPDRLTVGVVKNLVQDPQFTSGIREVGDPWAILGPAAAFPEFNYLRCAATGALTDFYLADGIPVEAGTSLSFSILVLPTGAPTTASASIRVEFVAPDGTRLSGADQLAELSLIDAPAGIWTPIIATFVVPTGYVYASLRLGTAGQTTGTIDFCKPVAQALWSQVQSGNYIEGEAGWSLSDSTAQVDDLNVIGRLGTGALSTTALEIGGVDFAATLDAMPKGLMQFGRAATTVNTAWVGATEAILWEFHAGSVTAGRAYELTVHGHADGDSGAVNDVFDFLIRYTTDGTAPNLSSAIMDGTLTKVPMPSTYPRDAFEVRCTYLPQGNYAQLRTALCLRREAGGGNMRVTVTDINRALEFRMVDLGKFSGVLTGSLAQKSKLTGTPDAAPITSYYQEFPCTWARVYDGGGSSNVNGARVPDDPTSLQIGYASSVHGRALSLIGFDDVAIRNSLIGVTPTKIEMKFRVRKVYDLVNGLTIRWATTPVSTRVSSIADRTGWVTNRVTFSGHKEGSTYTRELPIAIATEFKTGATKSLAVYDAQQGETWHGTLYGESTAYEPVLKITGTF